MPSFNIHAFNVLEFDAFEFDRFNRDLSLPVAVAVMVSEILFRFVFNSDASKGIPTRFCTEHCGGFPGCVSIRAQRRNKFLVCEWFYLALHARAQYLGTNFQAIEQPCRGKPAASGA